MFQGLTNDAGCCTPPCGARIVCRLFVTNDFKLWLKCLNNRPSAVIKIHDYWTLNNSFFRHCYNIMAEPNMLSSRKAAVMDRFQRLKCTYPELPSSMHDFQVSCSDFWCPRKSDFTLYLCICIFIFLYLASTLELITFEILAAERLRLMEFDNQLIIDCFSNVVNILIW